MTTHSARKKRMLVSERNCFFGAANAADLIVPGANSHNTAPEDARAHSYADALL